MQIHCNINGKTMNITKTTWRRNTGQSTLIGYSETGDVVCITPTATGYTIDIQSENTAAGAEGKA